ncbi:MAG: ABC transporter permease [Flavobacteriales bacterium]|jgi:peptide/nickel transport system permease protein|nr:ABC transporter permease [Flavobacteriales bacterium]MBT5089917.1 ABC transporter permease [Flavobacteriales bacterium]
MKANSLNLLAWKKLRNDKLSFASLVFIFLCVLLGFFAVILSPDSSPMANEMHIELATQKPFTKIIFLDIPKQDIKQVSFMEGIFIGKPSTVKRIPIDKYTAIANGVTYFPYQSEFKQTFIGDYNVKSQTFYFGTDKYGRDLLSRILYGIRISLSVGFIAVFLSLFIGITLGLIAGYFRGKTDDIIMWFVNVIWSIPTLLMVIAITLALGKGFWQVFVAVGLTMWVEVARIIRGQVLSIRKLEYVNAGKALAYKPFRIIFKHILPNVIGPVIVISAANFAAAILIEAGLSFLGIGAQPPIPSWGGMIKDHYSYIIMDKAYLAIIPGMAIMILVLAFMLLGNGLRDAFDVKN